MTTMRDAHSTARRAVLSAAAALALIATALVVGTTSPAYACTCAAIDLQTQAEQGDAVFVGTPVDVSDEGTDHVYEVRVSDVYSGTADPVTTVRTAADATCGVNLKLDRQYMFIGEQAEAHGEVTTGLCSGTQPISDQVIADVEKALGPATPYRDANTGGADGRGQDGDTGQEPTDGTSSGDKGPAANDTGDSDSFAPSDDADEASGSSDDGDSMAFAVVGVVLALAIGASFALPQLRRHNRNKGR